METRPFGTTGESFPILSFGGQRIVDEHDCTEEEAIEIVNKANTRWRTLNTLAEWTLGLSTMIFLVLFFITPVRRNPSL